MYTGACRLTTGLDVPKREFRDAWKRLTRSSGGGTLSIQPHFRGALHARQNVIHGLTAQPNQLPAHDFGHKVLRDFEHSFRRRTIQTFAQNRRHRAREGLHVRTKIDPKMRRPRPGIHAQKDSHGVRAFFVLPRIL